MCSQLTEPHAIAVDSRDRIYVADRTGNRINVYEKDGKFVTSWKQFGRPSGVTVDKNDIIYVADSQSNDMNNPGCKMGIRVGSVKDGKVSAYIPPPPGVTNELPPPEGIAIGDRAFLLLQGKWGPAIIGYGRVNGGPENDDGKRRVPIKFENLVDPSTEVLLG